MNEFVIYINEIIPLEAEAKADFGCRIKSKEYRKGQVIVSESSICGNLFFLKNGLVKFYFISNEGKEVIFRFFGENSVFTSLESFLTQKGTPHIIVALERTKVDFLSKQDLEELCLKYHSFEKFYRLILSIASINMIKRFSELMKDDASVRYSKFVFENNVLMQRISLGDLANYLGITQVSLSRIRASR